VQQLLSYLQDKTYCSFDCETDGLAKRSQIIGYSLCAESDIAYYVVTREWDREKQAMTVLETNSSAPDVMKALINKPLLMHNATFDCDKVHVNYGVDLMPSVHTDTMILAHLLDENRHVGLKSLGAKFYGEQALVEKEEMVSSIERNGGSVTKGNYELYKADSELIAKYGAKDAILTFNLFWEMLPELMDEGLDKFFYEEESMPLLRGPTYDLNTEGLKVDVETLGKLKKTLEVDIATLYTDIHKDIADKIKDKYPGDTAKTTFNIGSGPQLAWLLYDQLGEVFYRLTDGGKEWADSLQIGKIYTDVAKRNFIHTMKQYTGQVVGGRKVREYWNYISVDEEALKKVAAKYKWVQKLLQYKKLTKLLSTYVEGIEESLQYGVIRPSFLQHGTTSGRYSSRDPNFTNLPRDDKRIKSCIVSRPGKVFVGADFEQIEPRIFASLSGDERLLNCFKNGEDFYSVIGMEVFNKTDAVPLKEGRPDAFGIKYKKERQISKTIALAATYGATAPRIASVLGISMNEAQEILDTYFETFPSVKYLQTRCHKQVKTEGRVVSLFGRPRRLPEGIRIGKVYMGVDWMDMPYQAKTVLNLAVNFVNQSAAASILNRSMIAFKNTAKAAGIDCKIVLCVHDEIIVECKEEEGELVSAMLKNAMQQTCRIPGVDLVAIPKIAKNLGDLK
jgi:DNA polymerase-1